MPYELVRDSIEKSLKEKCRLLRRYIHNVAKKTGMTRNNLINHLLPRRYMGMTSSHSCM